MTDRERDMAVKDGDGEPPLPSAVARAGLRAVAADLLGAERVDAEWTPNGPMRARVRRLARRAGDGDAPPCGMGPGSGVPAGAGRLERSP